uniref:Uncharacterized protein n=1 Tax=Myotis myotis TaxID=51298 RepID=A0A7J8ANB8_MYOMY|nr:hypothetical protein mMyoMyo1_008164 [Myotis myotis]
MGSSDLRIPAAPVASLTSHHNHLELQAVLTSDPGVQSLTEASGKARPPQPSLPPPKTWHLLLPPILQEAIMHKPWRPPGGGGARGRYRVKGVNGEKRGHLHTFNNKDNFFFLNGNGVFLTCLRMLHT